MRRRRRSRKQEGSCFSFVACDLASSTRFRARSRCLVALEFNSHSTEATEEPLFCAVTPPEWEFEAGTRPKERRGHREERRISFFLHWLASSKNPASEKK